MSKEVPQRHSWDSRDTVQRPVNWPKELKDDPFKARKEVIHQEINRKAKNMGRPRKEALERQFPCLYSCLPQDRKSSRAIVSRPHRLPGASLPKGIQDPLPVPQWFLRTVIPAHRGSGPATSSSRLNSWRSPSHLLQFSLQCWRSSAEPVPLSGDPPRTSAQQAHTPNLLSKCLERVQRDGQCTEGRGAHGMGWVGVQGAQDSKPPRGKAALPASGSGAKTSISSD